MLFRALSRIVIMFHIASLASGGRPPVEPVEWPREEIGRPKACDAQVIWACVCEVFGSDSAECNYCYLDDPRPWCQPEDQTP